MISSIEYGMIRTREKGPMSAIEIVSFLVRASPLVLYGIKITCFSEIHQRVQDDLLRIG